MILSHLPIRLSYCHGLFKLHPPRKQTAFPIFLIPFDSSPKHHQWSIPIPYSKKFIILTKTIHQSEIHTSKRRGCLLPKSVERIVHFCDHKINSLWSWFVGAYEWYKVRGRYGMFELEPCPWIGWCSWVFFFDGIFCVFPSVFLWETFRLDCSVFRCELRWLYSLQYCTLFWISCVTNDDYYLQCLFN